jgi:hypothetical protein
MTDSNRDDDSTVLRRAYERYESRGREDGRDQEDWFAAEEDIRSRPEEEQARQLPDDAETATPHERSAEGGQSTRGHRDGVIDPESARASGTGPTSTPTGTGPGGNVRTPGTAVSGGPTEGGR